MLAFAENQGDFLTSFTAEKGRKPNLKEFRNWQEEVAKAKAASSDKLAERDPQSARLIWHYADVEWRVTYIKEVTKEGHKTPFLSAMRSIILNDHSASLLLHHEEGYRYAFDQAIAARDLKPMVSGHWARRRGYNRFRAGKPCLSLKECISVLNGVKLD